jgi:hypothetical protein
MSNSTEPTDHNQFDNTACDVRFDLSRGNIIFTPTIHRSVALEIVMVMSGTKKQRFSLD